MSSSYNCSEFPRDEFGFRYKPSDKLTSDFYTCEYLGVDSHSPTSIDRDFNQRFERTMRGSHPLNWIVNAVIGLACACFGYQIAALLMIAGVTISIFSKTVEVDNFGKTLFGIGVGAFALGYFGAIPIAF